MADDDKNKKPLSLNDRLLFGLSHSRQGPLLLIAHRFPFDAHPCSISFADDRAHKVKIEGRRRLCKLSSASDDTIADEKLFDSPPRKHSGDGGESIRDILDDLSSRLETLSVEKHHHKPLRRDAEPSFCLSGFDDDDDVEEVEKREDNKGKAVKAPAFDGDVEEDCVAFDEDDGQNEESFCDGDGDRDDVRLDGMRICKAQTYVLPGKIAKRLYPHQRDGLVWLWSLHCGGTGGILGDDMGLGKTMQASWIKLLNFISSFA